MISEGFKLCYCMFTTNDIRRFQGMLLYVYIQCYQEVSSYVIVCSHQMISGGFKLCYCMFTSNDIRRFQAMLCMFISNDIRRFQAMLLYVHIK